MESSYYSGEDRPINKPNTQRSDGLSGVKKIKQTRGRGGWLGNACLIRRYWSKALKEEVMDGWASRGAMWEQLLQMGAGRESEPA